MIVDEVNQDSYNDVKMVEFFLKFNNNKYRVSEISLEQFCIMAFNLMNQRQKEKEEQIFCHFWAPF